MSELSATNLAAAVLKLNDAYSSLRTTIALPSLLRLMRKARKFDTRARSAQRWNRKRRSR